MNDILRVEIGVRKPHEGNFIVLLTGPLEKEKWKKRRKDLCVGAEVEYPVFHLLWAVTG